MANCSCSGVRSCLICEEKNCVISSKNDNPNEENLSLKKNLHFCNKCKKLYRKTQFNCKCNVDNHSDLFHPNLASGIRVIENFITRDEEDMILKVIDQFPWRMSQSGRRKQDFGPKVNFKRRKLKSGNFTGLPKFCEFIVQRLHSNVVHMNDFHPVELCNLEYCPERGSSIDPHIDDIWVWGERLVTVNLLSNTALTLTHSDITSEVQIPMPRRSLIILEGEARHRWMHGIKREHVTSRRIAITLRELSEEFLTGETYSRIGESLLQIASTFNGQPSSM